MKPLKSPKTKRNSIDFEAVLSWLASTMLSVGRGIRKYRSWMLFFAATLAILSLVTAVLLAGREGWRNATSNNECQMRFPSPPYPVFGYLEFFLQKQELSEPVFNGSFFINLTQEYGKAPMRLKMTTSAVGNYASSTYIANLSWDEIAQVLWMTDQEKMDFVAKTGSHRNFPFDSATFDFTVKTDPLVNLPYIRFNNRVPGFYMPCDTVKALRLNDGTFQITFELQRDLLTRLAAVVLFFAAVIFAVAITFAETKALPTAIASYFFSLWSIRGIFGLSPEGFPTYLDLGILSLCILILVLLAMRILIRGYRKVNGSSTPAGAV